MNGNVFEELASKEHEMRQVLCNAVVEDMMALFLCVLFVSFLSHGVLRPVHLIFRSLEHDCLISS
jgi:hypothetical protein